MENSQNRSLIRKRSYSPCDFPCRIAPFTDNISSPYKQKLLDFTLIILFWKRLAAAPFIITF